MTNLPSPPLTEGSDAHQIVEVRRYLFRLVEDLNKSLNSLTADNFVPDTAAQISAAAGSGGSVPAPTKQAIEGTATELKSMIIKNAKIVEQEIDALTEEFESKYVAQSEYGTFKEQINDRVTQTASGLEQEITTKTEILAGDIENTRSDLTEEIGITNGNLESGLNASSQALSRYIAETSGYIKQGIVRYDGVVPIIGIAIGQDISVTGEKETVGGTEYDVIDTRHNMSIWTSEKLSFFVNGSEVAYFANDALNIRKLYVGNWSIENVNGFSIKWIGGAV